MSLTSFVGVHVGYTVANTFISDVLSDDGSQSHEMMKRTMSGPARLESRATHDAWHNLTSLLCLLRIVVDAH